MTVETATDFNIDQAIEATFDAYRSRIALLSVEACGALSTVFASLSSVTEQVIDIEAIEWEQFEIDIAADTELAVA